MNRVVLDVKDHVFKIFIKKKCSNDEFNLYFKLGYVSI